MADKGYALVTGASSGIGADIARRLAAQGYPLVLVARRRDRLEALQAELGARVKVVVLDADLGVPGASRQLFDRVRELGLDVDILVNNAGVGIGGRFLGMELPRISQMFQLNITALTELTQLFAVPMVARGRGHVLQVASLAAFSPTPRVAAYAATKAYVLSFSEALRFELRGTGVSLTTLYPGITTTEFGEVSGARTPGLMQMSILTADQVAEAGLAGMFAGRGTVIPGWINWMSSLAMACLPMGLMVWVTGRLMERANR